MPSLASWIVQSSLVSAFAATATFIVYTKHCHFTPVSAATDPLFQSKFYAKFNPHRNPGIHDLCVRKIPLFKVRRELIEDAEAGGGQLVERFAGGVWGNFGCLVQRKYLASKYRQDPSMKHMLWDKKELLESRYDEGTDVMNHFQVIEKTPTSILFRCGDSPLASPDAPRDSDGLFEVTAKADLDKGFAEFSLKSVFYAGQGKKEVKQDEKMIEFAHRMYTKLLMETGIKNCML